MRNRYYLSLFLFIVMGFAFEINAQSQATKPAASPKQQAQAKKDLRRVFTFQAGANSLFDSNIEHDPIAKRAYGIIPSIGLGYEVGWGKNNFEINYEVARHFYNVDTKYNRTSHGGNIAYERKFTDRFRSRTNFQATFKGSTDEREINNEFILSQRFEFRANSKNRFYVTGAYRMKRYVADDRDSNSSNPYWGIRYRRYLGKQELEVGYRYEKNKAASSRNTYIQPRFEAGFKTPLFYRSNLSLDFSYKPRKYAGRFVDINGVDVPRRDKRWKFTALWERPITERFVLGVYYEYEKRNSNDIDKLFKAHQIGISFRFNWTKEFDN